MSFDSMFQIPLTYRNALPRLWFLYMYKHKFLDKGYKYRFGGDVKTQYELLQETINKLPDGSAQRLHKNICAYCGTYWKFREGDHVIDKKRWKQQPELNNLVYRINCCRKCNSSRLNKDLLFWWFEKKHKDPLKTNYDIITVYCKAEYKFRKFESSLDENIPVFMIEVIKKLHLLIDDDSYADIWKPYQARLQI